MMILCRAAWGRALCMFTLLSPIIIMKEIVDNDVEPRSDEGFLAATDVSRDEKDNNIKKYLNYGKPFKVRPWDNQFMPADVEYAGTINLLFLKHASSLTHLIKEREINYDDPFSKVVFA